MKYPELKPCPFCRGRARRSAHKYSGKLVSVEDGSNGLPVRGEYEQLAWYAVKCGSCGVSQPTRKYHTREESDAAWNGRA